MSEEQKLYHELEGMQELGLLKEGTNISEILDEYVELNKKIEIVEKTNDEIENQMVVGEYYNEGESTNEQSGS